MSQHHRRKQWIFDRWAPFYDWPLTSVFYQALHLRLLSFLDLPESPHVLDLGCGTGKLLNRLMDEQGMDEQGMGKQAALTGIGLDLSAEMISQARQANGHPQHLQYQQGNAEALPFEAAQFDAAFSTISFLHYPDPEAVLTEVRRVLRPGGHFYLVDFAPRWAEEPVLLAQAASTIRFYGPQVRDRLGDRAHLPVLKHQYLLGPVMLTIFGTEPAVGRAE